MVKEIKQEIVHFKPDISMEHLKEYEGKNVCVFYSVAGNDRNGFMTSISVFGELEIHPDNDKNYRVLINRGGNHQLTKNLLKIVQPIFISFPFYLYRHIGLPCHF